MTYNQQSNDYINHLQYVLEKLILWHYITLHRDL